MPAQQLVTVGKNVTEKPVSLAEAKSIYESLAIVFKPNNICLVGHFAIERMADKWGVPQNARRPSLDVDVYVQEPITDKKIAALDHEGIKPFPGENIDPDARVLFLRKKVTDRFIPVDILQGNVFDHKVTEKGHNIRITNTQNVIMRDVEDIDGMRVPSMAFMTIIKAVAEIERGIRLADKESPLKTDKHCRDVDSILRYILRQTPEQFMNVNKDMIRDLLRGNRESERTLRKVLERCSPLRR